MKLNQVVKERPVATAVTLASMIGGAVILFNFMPAMELIVRIKNAPQVADEAKAEAGEAKAKAEEAREWIDAYIAEEKRQQEFDQAMREKELEYQRQTLELQRQLQQANPAPREAPTTPRETTWIESDTSGTCWSCSAFTYEDCWDPDAQTGENRWRLCE